VEPGDIETKKRPLVAWPQTPLHKGQTLKRVSKKRSARGYCRGGGNIPDNLCLVRGRFTNERLILLTKNQIFGQKISKQARRGEQT